MKLDIYIYIAYSVLYLSIYGILNGYMQQNGSLLLTKLMEKISRIQGENPRHDRLCLKRK